MIRDDLRGAIEAARTAAISAGDISVASGAALPTFSVERPARPEHGDYATNAAMQLAPLARRSPLEIAERLRARLTLPDGVAAVAVERPGFINFRLDDGWVAAQIDPILEAGERFGRGELGAGRRVNVEFISANPTGPLHIGNGRGAFVGGTLASVLQATGHEVVREYYVNDYGSQLRDFGESVYLARTGQAGDAGYKGAYIADLAAEVPPEVLAEINPLPAIGAWAWNRVLGDIRRTLERLRIRIDVWRSESELHAAGEVAEAIARLREAGQVYESDGALWFRSTTFGDDKDRVLIRSNGAPTYFAADVAYLVDKFRRGFDTLIYILGPDHHGDVARLKGACAALGHDPDRMEIIIYQHVRLAGGAKMSKRAGTFVTLDELVEEVGPDATAFFFNMRSATQHLDFDLELARRQSNENPVYYVQYAHARCSSILRNAAAEGRSWTDGAAAAAAAERLRHPAEQGLIRKLLELPEVVEDAVRRRETHELPQYCLTLATAFSIFYRDCRVLSDDGALSAARIRLVAATRQALANALGLMGISAPETM